MSSPAVLRAIRVLDFLATHPAEEFTLTELARQLDISKATMHTVLAMLGGHGYVVRDAATHRFALGASLIPIASMAEHSNTAVHHARAAADEIAARLGIECVVTWASRSELVIVSRSGPPRRARATTSPGQRLPLAPPIGTVFIAWSAPGDIDAWLARLGADAGEEQVERHRWALDEVRRRGFAVGLDTPTFSRLAALYADGPVEIHTAHGQEELALALGELEEAEYLLSGDHEPTTPIRFVSVPIFDHAGQLALALAISTSGKAHTVADLPVLTGELLRGAASVMASIGGRHPDAHYLGDAPSIKRPGG